ncbi:MAG: signal peptidase II [Fusobacterium gastrosuis]|uniref:signal peptidase II n=1 Tax=Fusobacterium TaxID=848 RepID=UPI001F4FE213|nr:MULTISPECIES: signal peptidase II [Fusobacterium]MDD7391744.1 signal peptidase II [Fusobacteriaceae bacterium]MCI5724895.1 signal peptidase II [Fusobacterium sp.]MCI7224243.1 signal peptidase II [Fusobacterium sp.]MDD7410642.1 signal peptidase II [Fusobacteriaceae bacterium]MDY4010390.1 signal peptidase II [Fusobacterium gastrosuis]
MVYIFLFLIMLVIDQYTKYIIDTNFLLGESSVIIDGFFNLTYVQNRGMAFGLFQGKIDVVSILALFAILAIAGYFIKNFKKMNVLERIAYTMIFSGAIGNLIDRFLRGFVIDMLDFRGIWTFIFNFADVWINIGVILIVIEYIFFSKNRRN